MRQITEVTSIFKKDGYSIENIIIETIKKFNLKTLCNNAGIKKEVGYTSTDILVLLIMMPLMLSKSVNGIYKTIFKKNIEMKKDVFYRFKNNEKLPWRNLLYKVAKKYMELVDKNLQKSQDYLINSNKENKITAFVLDDTTDARVGYKIENISHVFDHTINKTVYGFKHLVLGFFDGTSLIPLDFSTHQEKKLKKSKAKKQYVKEIDNKTNGSKRRKETKISKIQNGISMIKRAVKNGFIADYVLVDSWFTSLDFVKEIRSIKNGAMHIIAGIRNDNRKYSFEDQLFNGKQIIAMLKSKEKAKRNRKWNVRYYELVVNYKGVGDVKLFICRYPFQKKWRIFISTDIKLEFVEMMKIYGIRWSIEVMFRELKQNLNLGKCQSRDFDAQIANVTLSLLLYIFLSYSKRMESYETIGALFQHLKDNITEKNLAERLWNLFEEMLQLIIDVIAQNGHIEISRLKETEEYLFIKDMFESSFLSKQLSELNKSA